MRLAEIMSTKVFTTQPGRPVSEALEEMRRHDVHHLVVVEGGHVVGVISRRDRGNPAIDQQVRDVMQGHIITAKTTTTVREAANLLRGHTIGCLPIFDGDRLAGIVTTSDLLELIGRGVENPVAETTPWTVGRKPSRPQKRH